jgi:trans-aconitate methyltransferase
MKVDNQNDRWNAQHYKKNAAASFKRRINIIHGLNFRRNENVLDIGCGDGRITAEIAKLVPNGFVLGIDISQNMITEAQKCFGNIKNLEFQCVDAAGFSSDKKFDLAVSFGVFHWIKDQSRALKNIYNHLKSDAKLIIKTAAFDKSPISEVNESSKWTSLLSKKEQTYFPQTAESFGRLLGTAGFQNIDVKLEITTRTFQSKDELFNWAFAWVPHSTQLPEDKAREYTQDIVDRVCATRNDGQIILESALLDARAVKP